MPKQKKVKLEPSSVLGKRPKNFTTEEDVFLARAYAKATLDPIFGNDQKSSTFWAKVHENFRIIETNECEVEQVGLKRDAKSLQNRFKRHIQADTQKFVAIKNAHPKESGENDERHFNRLLEEYRYKEGKPFRFAKCWEYLEVIPMFNLATNKGEEDENFTSDDKDGGDDASATAAKTAVLTLDRPIGSKQAKKRAKLEQIVEKNKEATAQAIREVGQNVKECAKAMDLKVRMEYFQQMLQRYDRLGDTHNATLTLQKMQVLMEGSSTEKNDSVSGDASDDIDEEEDDSSIQDEDDNME